MQKYKLFFDLQTIMFLFRAEKSVLKFVNHIITILKLIISSLI